MNCQKKKKNTKRYWRACYKLTAFIHGRRLKKNLLLLMGNLTVFCLRHFFDWRMGLKIAYFSIRNCFRKLFIFGLARYCCKSCNDRTEWSSYGFKVLKRNYHMRMTLFNEKTIVFVFICILSSIYVCLAFLFFFCITKLTVTHSGFFWFCCSFISDKLNTENIYTIRSLHRVVSFFLFLSLDRIKERSKERRKRRYFFFRH
ncbi:uncharacterized protein BYT42DRAFT_552147 [Radiomyces spectabilis]|uniref:uncharacterized protein n=1 Tax=Radiomyces spectabilis TaxID=64574 RepID=UPI00221FE624|nr:uncharacterized protein BYT42DRAFT_552147 [Radiomyces spectabilis]KAI8393749.1 hypothetical protein BYT42DRAFT_552147 [Radiomyces spectabilis]